MSYDPNQPLPCPISGCPTRTEPYELHAHLVAEHPPAELADRLVQLAVDLPYHRSVECEKCGTYGARPGDHPLCESCETEIGLIGP